MKLKNNRKRVSAKRETVIIHESTSGVSFSLNELEMRSRMFGPYGSTSFSDFQNQIQYVRRKSAEIAHGF